MNNPLTRRACRLGSPLPVGEGNPYHRAFPLHYVFPLPVGEGQGEGDSRLARQLQTQYQDIKEGDKAQIVFTPPAEIGSMVYICRLMTPNTLIAKIITIIR